MFDALRVTSSQDHPGTRVGVPRESRGGERRVVLVPKMVEKLPGRGTQVVIEYGLSEDVLIQTRCSSRPGATINDLLTAPPATTMSLARWHR
jgi:NAD/NADP transhydrogenase alpha subunit